MRHAWLVAALGLALAAPPLAAPASAASGRQCVVCPRPIPQYGTWGTYTIDGTKYLVHADDPEPPQCRYCGGLMSAYSPWGKAIRYADGRQVCRRCASSAINDVKSAQATLDEVRATMTSWGMRFPWGRIPVKLVGQRELVRIIAKDHPGMKPDGVCQPELTKRFLSAKWEVTNLQIFMLTGLPRFVFEKTVAHELTHAWMALAGCPRDQTPEFREGACNLAAYFYLQTRDTPAAAKLKHLMLQDDDPIYGEGLRRHIRYATDHRVRGMLALLKTSRDFPPGY